jgi:hypothetical protein
MIFKRIGFGPKRFVDSFAPLRQNEPARVDRHKARNNGIAKLFEMRLNIVVQRRFIDSSFHDANKSKIKFLFCLFCLFAFVIDSFFIYQDCYSQPSNMASNH